MKIPYDSAAGKKIALKAVVKKATTALAHGDLADVILNPAASYKA